MAIQDTVRRKLTYEDYILIPDDGLRHEILDGEHYVNPAPTLRHQGVAGALYRHLGPFVYGHRLGEIFFAPVDILFSMHDIAQPDLVFISNERAGILTEPNVKGAPDLVVEILSPSTRRTDEGIKRAIYERSGVLEYWLVDPKSRTLRVLRQAGAGFGPSELLSADAGDVLTSPLFPGLEIPVSEIFE